MSVDFSENVALSPLVVFLCRNSAQLGTLLEGAKEALLHYFGDLPLGAQAERSVVSRRADLAGDAVVLQLETLHGGKDGSPERALQVTVRVDIGHQFERLEEGEAGQSGGVKAELVERTVAGGGGGGVQGDGHRLQVRQLRGGRGEQLKEVNRRVGLEVEVHQSGQQVEGLQGEEGLDEPEDGGQLDDGRPEEGIAAEEVHQAVGGVGLAEGEHVQGEEEESLLTAD